MAPRRSVPIKKHDTVARAFAYLQAKGFVVVTEPASLGMDGEGKSFAFEITELPLPGEKRGRQLYLNWKPGDDHPVVRGSVNNPFGRNGKIKPCPEKEDRPVLKLVTK